MAKRRCKSCSGTYETDQGGTTYFHACAPIPNPTYQPDPAKPAFNPVETIERPNKRDENLVIDASGKLVGEKSPGAGFDAL